jgi:hypothetical protein
VATFRDRHNREWVLDLDVYGVEQIHKRTEVRIDQLIANKAAGLEELMSDPVKFVRVLWVLVEEQAERAGVTPEQFGRSLAGDSLEAAADAFLEALQLFSPRRLRTMLKAMTAKGAEIADAQMKTALAAIEKLGPQSSTSVTTAPPSSASTPPGAG